MAITTSNTRLRNPGSFFIGGDWVKPASDSTIDVFTPSTEELFARVAEAQAADIDRAVAAARDAFDKGPWPRMSHVERARYLRNIADIVIERADDLAHAWTSEVGALRTVGEVAMPALGETYRYYAGLADEYPWEERHTPEAGNVGLLVREPVGVVGAIVPWNGPASLIAYKLAPALLAGCTVILKNAPESPVTGLLMAEMFEKAGLPKGVVNVVTAESAMNI